MREEKWRKKKKRKEYKLLIKRIELNMSKLTQYIKRGIRYVLHGEPIVENKVVANIVTLAPNELLKGRTALILGGTSGIGLSIAESFLKSGCNVIVASSTQKKIDNILQNINSHHVKGIQIDISCPELFKDKIIQAEALFGPIDILVNSSGVHTENVNFFSMTPNEYDRVMNINLRGSYFIVQTVAQRMIMQKIEGKIILIGSNRGDEPAFSPYGISKWGIKGMVYGLAKELIPYNIQLNAIAPGTTATNMIGYHGGSISSSENKIGRLVMPVEVANIAKLLVSEAGNMITGEIIHVSCGRGIFDIR